MSSYYPAQMKFKMRNDYQPIYPPERDREQRRDYIPPPSHIIGMNHVHHRDYAKGALSEVAVYVHPLMETLKWVIGTLRMAGAKIVFMNPESPPTPCVSQPHGGPVIREHYLLVPVPREFDYASRDHPASKYRLPAIAPWATQVTAPFLDTRLVRPNVRPADHPLYRPFPFALPIPNFPYTYITIFGQASALLSAYRHFCEAARDGPRVYDQERHYATTHRAPLDKVELVVISPTSRDSYLDFAGEHWWHDQPKRRAATTLLRELEDLAYRRCPPVFVQQGWVTAAIDAAIAGEGVPSVQPFIITLAYVQQAISDFCYPRPLPTPPPSAFRPLPNTSFSPPRAKAAHQALISSSRKLPEPNPPRKHPFTDVKERYEKIPSPPRNSNQKRKLERIDQDWEDQEKTKRRGTEVGLLQALPVQQEGRVEARPEWHYIEVLLGMDLLMDVLDLLEAKFEKTPYLDFSPAARTMYDSTPPDAKDSLVIRVGTTVDTGFTLVATTILEEIKALPELQIVDATGKIMFMRRGAK